VAAAARSSRLRVLAPSVATRRHRLRRHCLGGRDAQGALRCSLCRSSLSHLVRRNPSLLSCRRAMSAATPLRLFHQVALRYSPRWLGLGRHERRPPGRPPRSSGENRRRRRHPIWPQLPIASLPSGGYRACHARCRRMLGRSPIERSTAAALQSIRPKPTRGTKVAWEFRSIKSTTSLYE
jgi:hypothetical protein